jgi:hypothetical protein
MVAPFAMLYQFYIFLSFRERSRSAILSSRAREKSLLAEQRIEILVE